MFSCPFRPAFSIHAPRAPHSLPPLTRRFVARVGVGEEGVPGARKGAAQATKTPKELGSTLFRRPTRSAVGGPDAPPPLPKARPARESACQGGRRRARRQQGGREGEESVATRPPRADPSVPSVPPPLPPQRTVAAKAAAEFYGPDR